MAGPQVHVSTFSIAAIDRTTGEIGIAVASKFLAVGAVVPWARADVGAVATQAWANLSYGPDGLELLETGRSAEDVVRTLTAPDEKREHRQLGVVDRLGGAAAWTGSECYDWAGHRTGDGFACQGNILSGPGVVDALAATFEQTSGPFPERLLSALDAGQAAGGDRRGQQSAALYVVKEKGSYGGYLDRYIDLRVDDHPSPVPELRKLLELHRLYFGETAPGNLIRLTGPIIDEVQDILRRAGFLDGGERGGYDPATQAALRRLCSVENFEERWREDDFVDREVLHFMRKRFGNR
ncbi:MAG TPA: DUF1028 domain-containing protein [bacterium]|jgi:uncharacterized Ntn-hydrolase superfamily protein